MTVVASTALSDPSTDDATEAPELKPLNPVPDPTTFHRIVQ